MREFQSDFLEFAVAKNVLRFGEFQTKAGRLSPYFFNAGLICDGASVGQLAGYYAQALIQSGLAFDMLFGPAYKGIVLAATTAVALAEKGQNVPFCYNRKEAKDHGEGGSLVGAALKGRVVIIDDVISAGTSVRESVALIRQHGAEPAGVLIALDRQERGVGALSATQEVEAEFGIPVIPIARLDDLIRFLQGEPDLERNLLAVETYRSRYGVNAT